MSIFWQTICRWKSVSTLIYKSFLWLSNTSTTSGNNGWCWLSIFTRLQVILQISISTVFPDFPCWVMFVLLVFHVWYHVCCLWWICIVSKLIVTVSLAQVIPAPPLYSPLCFYIVWSAAVLCWGWILANNHRLWVYWHFNPDRLFLCQLRQWSCSVSPIKILFLPLFQFYIHFLKLLCILPSGKCFIGSVGILVLNFLPINKSTGLDPCSSGIER